MEVHPKVKVEYVVPHGPPVLTEHYVSGPPVLTEQYVPRTREQNEHYIPRTSETSDHYVTRTSESNEQYVPRTTEKSDHYVPRTSEQSACYSPRTTEHSERYVSRTVEQTEHYVPRNIEHTERYVTRASEQPEQACYIQRTPTHYIVRPSSYYPTPPNGEENSVIMLHPLIIGKDVVICMPEVNKVLRHVYQVLSQANYYLSKHGISSRRYTGAQLIRIKMLGILGHEAKVCSYILLKDAERVFDSFDVSGDCHKSPNISWMDPVLLDEKPIPEIARKSPDLSPQEPLHEGPVTVYLFKLDNDIIICAPDVQKVVQANFHQGATVGYYFTKLGIVPHKFLHTSHLDKVKELGIIKRSAVHCTYIMKTDAMCVFEAYGMDAVQVKEKVIFSDIIELPEITSKSWKPLNMSMNTNKDHSPNLFKTENPNDNNSPTTLSPKKERFSPNGMVVKNSLQHLVDTGSPDSPVPPSGNPSIPDDDEERRLIPPDAPNDFTVNVFVVEGEEVVCMPDIHKIVQSIHGNSIQVNYYFNKLRVAKKRFCFAHLRELKAKRILQNNATYCTYVPRADAEKLFQIYCLVDDPKLKEIIWTEPINLEVKLSEESNRSSGDPGNSESEDVTIHTFKLEENVVITVPDVHKIVDFLDEQSASLDYHFRKLGIIKCRFTYSQLHQLRRLNVIKRPTVCTYVTRGDMDKLLGMYETERNRHKMERLKFLEPITLVAGTVPNKPKLEASPDRFDEFMETPSDLPSDRPQFSTPESPGPNFLKPASHSEIMSPNSAAISYIQNAHPAIDCPIVIPNGDYDPTKVNDEHHVIPPNDVLMNGKHKHFDHPEQMFNAKKLKCKSFLSSYELL